MRDKPIKAIAYCRVATANQSQQRQQDKAYEAQKYRLNKAAAELNFEIVAWFKHVGSAAQPELNKELKEAHRFLVKNPDVCYLLATEPTRLSRSAEGFHFWLSMLNAHEVAIRFTEIPPGGYEQYLMELMVKHPNFIGQIFKKCSEA